MTTKRRLTSGAEAPAGKGRRSVLAGPAALVGAVMAVFAVLFWTLARTCSNQAGKDRPGQHRGGRDALRLALLRLSRRRRGGSEGTAVARRRPRGRRLFPFDRPDAAGLAQRRAGARAAVLQRRPDRPDRRLRQLPGHHPRHPWPRHTRCDAPVRHRDSRLPDAFGGQLAVPVELRPVPCRLGCGRDVEPRLCRAQRAPATPTQIAEAIRVGPRPMPNFGPGQFTDQQVSAIADYVTYMSHSNNPGGLGIAYFGPVPEGFVAIIFGLGLAPARSRFIGNRG